MTRDPRCDSVRQHLDDAFFARAEPAASDAGHAGRCPDCGAHRAALSRLADAFAADAPPAARDALVHATLERAAAELRRRDAAVARPPLGYRRTLGRLVAFAALPLPLVVAWNAAVLAAGAQLLAWLPPSLLQVLAAGYVLAGATWLACLYGSLPLVAHRQVHRHAPEAAT
jgi:hypothetical protein